MYLNISRSGMNFASQAIPRTMWLDSNLGDNLLQAPIEEVKSLRGDKVSRTDVELETGSISKIDGSSGGQVRMFG